MSSIITPPRAPLLALILLLAPVGCGEAQTEVATIVPDPLASVLIKPDTTIHLRAGQTFHFLARVTEEANAALPLRWSSSDPAIVAIDPVTGVAVGTGPGVARIWAEVDLAAGRRPAPSRGSAAASLPNTGPTGVPVRPAEFVTFPSAELEAILGPQLRSGSAANPWPWFDRNEAAHGAKLWDEGNARDRANGYYYDHALVQYIGHYRTGDPIARERARAAADYWYESSQREAERYDGYSPREAALTGLMLRALDDKPEYWEFITRDARRHYTTWLGKRLDNGELYFGVRDGAYSLLFAAQLAQSHPEAAVREEFREMALAAATRYYARLQHEDGGWYWKDDGSDNAPGGVWEQPFMIGLLLEGMIEVHEMTGDTAVEEAILRSVQHLWSRYRGSEIVAEARGQGAAWRQVGYFNYLDGSVDGERALDGGWDTNTIREGRQRNTLILHAFGYAYQITGEEKYRQWGDEIFAATFGKAEGPGADPFYSLADFRGKEYNQAYRSGGRYLAWRAGR